jgi:hypothetical protein
MIIHFVLIEVHGWLMAGSTPAVPIPDPAIQAPPGPLTHATDLILGWMKWAGLVGAVGAFIYAGISMAIGRRNRNNMAVEGVISLPWVAGGLAVILGSASLVGFFV